MFPFVLRFEHDSGALFKVNGEALKYRIENEDGNVHEVMNECEAIIHGLYTRNELSAYYTPVLVDIEAGEKWFWNNPEDCVPSWEGF